MKHNPSLPSCAALLLALLVFWFPAHAQTFTFGGGGSRPLDPEDAFIIEVLSVSDGRASIGWRIAEGYYLYRDQIAAHTADGAALAVETSAGRIKDEAGWVPTWISGRVADTADAESIYFQPPTDAEIPEGKFGDAIKRGRDIFMNTSTNAGDYVGNGLSCSNCHLDGGRQPLSAPMWAAWTRYPMYRKKNDQINTMEDRVMGCFTFSMNAQHSVAGGPPPHGSDIYRDLESYMYWLATGAPVNEKLDGTGFGKVEKTELGYSPERGAEVFTANCAVCHGADGQGQKDANGRIVFPALWGPGSYNWGAGMARIDTAAAFIKNNMPLSQPGKLSDQEAWDVAAFINSHERPRDARQGDASIEDTRLRFHDGDQIYYGKELNGVLMGVGTPDPERPIGAPELPIGPTPLE